MRYIILLTIATILSTVTLYAQHEAPESIKVISAPTTLKAPPATNTSTSVVIPRFYIKDAEQIRAEELDAASRGLVQKPTYLTLNTFQKGEAKEPKVVLTTSIDDTERRCIRAENLAKKDNYNKELKYYQFGLPMGDFPHGIKRELLKEKYNLNFMMMGCEPVDSLMCYNREAERLLFRKYGKNFWHKVNEEVDRAANNTGTGPRNGYGRGEESKPSDR